MQFIGLFFVDSLGIVPRLSVGISGHNAAFSFTEISALTDFFYQTLPNRLKFPMESQPRRRRRPARSCVECRRRKIRCDRNDPCTRCVSVHAQCTYKLYGDQNKSPLQSLEGASGHLTLGTFAFSTSSHVQPFRGDAPSSRGHSHPLEPTTIGTPTLTGTPHHGSASIDEHPRHAQATDSAFADLSQRVQSLEQSSAQKPVHGLSETGREIFDHSSQPEDLQWIFTKTRVMRWSLWMSTAKEVRYA